MTSQACRGSVNFRAVCQNAKSSSRYISILQNPSFASTAWCSGSDIRARTTCRLLSRSKKGHAVAFGRDEWEEEVKSDAPDLKLANGTAPEPLATKKIAAKAEADFRDGGRAHHLPNSCW